MPALKAHVKGGRLILDEPTDLPEGAEVELITLDGDELDAEERRELHASLDKALEDSKAKRGMKAEEYLARYRASLERHSP